MTTQLRLNARKSSLLTILCVSYLCLVLDALCAHEVLYYLVPDCWLDGGGRVRRNASNIVYTPSLSDTHCLCVPLQVKVQELNTLAPRQQQQENSREGVLTHLTKELWKKLCKCVSVNRLRDFCAIVNVTQMLLMLSGDVERNPGPSEFC